MSAPILATKLYIPPPRPKIVLRSRLLERLNAGLRRKLTLISAPAGFGKTTLISEWISQQTKGTPGEALPPSNVAWLSLDEGDNDPARFLLYLIAALQTIQPRLGMGLIGVLQTPQPPPPESILVSLINELITLPEHFALVLDDYHLIDAKPIDDALTFLLEHLPPKMHLILTTREDPDLPLARLRARSQLTELRAADLRFTPSEAAEFLNQVMDLHLSAENITALENRTEGWIAGLQLAAISMLGLYGAGQGNAGQGGAGHEEVSRFIQSFTGSHHFVMDYLVEEVLHQQSDYVQTFLLRTSILDRLCAPLCEAVLRGEIEISGQETLEYLQKANLFLIPLDNERRWYRYHHLFADLLRQRLPKSIATSTEEAASYVNALHIRASQWFEDNDLLLEAFHHAGVGQDVDRAERLIDEGGLPLQFSGAAAAVLAWIKSLPDTVLNAKPSLWWRYAALLLINGQTTGVEENLRAAEMALAASAQPDTDGDGKTRNLIGQIATARATLALTRYDVEAMLAQSRRALEYLAPNSLFNRSTANWTLGYAHILLGDRLEARRALTDSIALSQSCGAIFTFILATIGLGTLQEADNQLHQAAETYRHILHLVGDQPQQIINEVHLGLARIFYEWNDLEAAQRHGTQSLQLAQRYERHIDRFVLCEVFLARLKLAQGDLAGAATLLAKTELSVRQNFTHRMPEVAAVQVPVLLRQGMLDTAAQMAQTYNLPLCQARVHLAQGDLSSALTVLEAYRQQMEAKGWQDERLKAMVLQAVALFVQGEKDRAGQLLGEALTLAEPGGFIRLFVDEGAPMEALLSRLKDAGDRFTEGVRTYIRTLLAAFETRKDTSPSLVPHPLVEPLSQREVEILQLIAEGLSNHEICERLFLALSTVKGHNQRIFGKLQVQRRTEAIARARELGLL